MTVEPGLTGSAVTSDSTVPGLTVKCPWNGRQLERQSQKKHRHTTTNDNVNNPKISNSWEAANILNRENDIQAVSYLQNTSSLLSPQEKKQKIQPGLPTSSLQWLPCLWEVCGHPHGKIAFSGFFIFFFLQKIYLKRSLKTFSYTVKGMESNGITEDPNFLWNN